MKNYTLEEINELLEQENNSGFEKGYESGYIDGYNACLKNEDCK